MGNFCRINSFRGLCVFALLLCNAANGAGVNLDLVDWKKTEKKGKLIMKEEKEKENVG